MNSSQSAETSGPGSSGDCEERVAGEAAGWLSLISVGEAPTRVNDIIFGNEIDGATGELPVAVPVLWYGLLTCGLGALLWRRYDRMAA